LIFAVYSPILATLSLGEFTLLTITRHRIADTVVLRCHGRIVHGDESALLCAALHNQGNDIVLDLEGVSAIDAAGIGALLSLQASGIYLKLMKPTEAVWSVLRLTRMESVFEICDELPPMEPAAPGTREAIPLLA
jgi:anti-anti-sigma factor